MTALEKLREATTDPFNPYVKEWKRQGGKVIGYFCNYFPEEIVYAMGFLPFRVRPAGCKETILADVYYTSVSCSYARSCLQYAIDGTFAFLDGVVGVNGCDQIRRLHDLWEATVTTPFLHFLSVPHTKGKWAVRWYKEELIDLKNHLEKAFGTVMAEEQLKKSVKLYNDTRALLRQLYELRKGDAPLLSGEEAAWVVLAAQVMPKEQYLPLLRQALHEVRARGGIQNQRARLLVVGSELDDPEYIGIIEKLGGLVVADVQCWGSKYFWEQLRTGEDLLESLADYYLKRPLCPRMADQIEERWERVKEMVGEFKVAGVIVERLRNCDLWGSEQHMLGEKLKREGIPYLILEREYALSGVGQMKTRVEAFLEMVAMGG